MQFESMPILKMQIEGLKTTIMSHLGVVGSELGEALSEEVNKAVASYDWEGQVKAIVHNTLNQKIESYFRWGGAGAKAIEQAVEEGFAVAIDKVTNKEK